MPDSSLINDLLACLVFGDELEDIPSLEVLGDNAESVGELIVEGIFVAEDVGVVNAGKNSNFIQAVSQLFFIQSRDTNLFHHILTTIFPALDLVDDWEGSLP